MPTIEIGKNYYYLDETDFQTFVSSLSGTGFVIGDFPFFKVDDVQYAGYYFEISEIDGGEEGDEWELLSPYASFTFAKVWSSVQAHYMGVSD